mgnify:CR=1 FL=1
MMECFKFKVCNDLKLLGLMRLATKQQQKMSMADTGSSHV